MMTIEESRKQRKALWVHYANTWRQRRNYYMETGNYGLASGSYNNYLNALEMIEYYS